MLQITEKFDAESTISTDELPREARITLVWGAILGAAGGGKSGVQLRKGKGGALGSGGPIAHTYTNTRIHTSTNKTHAGV